METSSMSSSEVVGERALAVVAAVQNDVDRAVHVGGLRIGQRSFQPGVFLEKRIQQRDAVVRSAHGDHDRHGTRL
jgi:hypothetical protein